MVDPLSTALGAYAALKAGVKAGRDLQELAGEIGKLWGYRCGQTQLPQSQEQSVQDCRRRGDG